MAKPKPPARKFAAAAKKPAPAKKIIAAAKPATPIKAVASAAPPSYTITTKRGDLTYTTTRIVPLPATPAPVAAAPAPSPPAPAAPPAEASREAKVAAVPVSLVQPVNAAPPAAKPALSPTEKPAPPAAVDAKQPPNSAAAASFVSNFLKDAFRIAKASGTTSLQRRAALAELFAGKMDVKRIAGYTTADELAALSPDIQQRFRTILVSYLVETYYPRLELAADPSIKVETAAATPLPDGTAVVWTTFTKEGWGSQSVQWHLAAADGGFKIVDIFSAGASLVQMERDTFMSVMRDGGLSQLMAKLDARTKELASAATE